MTVRSLDLTILKVKNRYRFLQTTDTHNALIQNSKDLQETF